MVLVTNKTGDVRFREQAVAMNQELMLSVVRQHELTESSAHRSLVTGGYFRKRKGRDTAAGRG